MKTVEVGAEVLVTLKDVGAKRFLFDSYTGKGTVLDIVSDQVYVHYYGCYFSLLIS